MTDPAAILMLIAMLAAGAASAKPFDLELSLIPGPCHCARRDDNSDGDGAGMHPAASFRRWYALDSVAAAFVIKPREVRSSDLIPQRRKQDALSAELAAQPHIRARELTSKKLAIVAALCRAYFENAFHGCALYQIPIPTGSERSLHSLESECMAPLWLPCGCRPSGPAAWDSCGLRKQWRRGKQ
jgi:hypothetical protein